MSDDDRKNGKVVSTALGRTAAGKPQFCVTFDCEPDKVTGKVERVSRYFFFEHDDPEILAKWDEQIVKEMKVLGWDVTANGWKFSPLHETDVLVGREASLVIEESEYNGRTTRKVRWINDPKGGGAMKEVMSKQDASTFDARLRARVSGQPPPAQRATVVTPQHQQTFASTPAGADEDVPF